MSKQAQGQHTPGPWAVERRKATLHGESDYPAVQGFRVSASQYSQDPEAVEANARLIAAAPDLLAACELAWDAFGGMDWASGSEADAALSALESVMAKARGGAA